MEINQEHKVCKPHMMWPLTHTPVISHNTTEMNTLMKWQPETMSKYSFIICAAD